MRLVRRSTPGAPCCARPSRRARASTRTIRAAVWSASWAAALLLTVATRSAIADGPAQQPRELAAASMPQQPGAAEPTRPSPRGDASARPGDEQLAEQQGWPAFYVAGTVLGIAGLVDCALGVVFTIKHLNDWDAAHDYCPGFDCDQHATDLASTGQTSATIAQASFMGGGILLGVAAALFIAQLRYESPADGSTEPTDAAGSVHVAPWAPPGALGAGVDLRF